MGLDIKKLRGMTKELNNKSGDGEGLFLYANKLGEEDDVRILPPPEEANGLYFVEQSGWWVNGKFYITHDTEILGGVDVINEEIEIARKSTDEDVLALVNKKNNGMPVLKKEYRSLIPILTLKTIYDDADEIISCSVEATKVLVAKPTLLTAIHKIVTGRQYQNKTDNGIADRVKGHNLILSKTGTGKDTKYEAMGWNVPMEMDEKYYDPKKVPNVFKLTEKAATSDEHLRSVIRNYLYGDAIVEDATDESESTKKESTPKTDTKSAKTGSARPKRGAVKEAATSADKKATRSLLDDAEATSGDDSIDDL